MNKKKYVSWFSQKDLWMDVTSHNVGLPALEIRKAECSGILFKSNKSGRNWRKRYCVLKDACIYYYKGMNSPAAQGNNTNIYYFSNDPDLNFV